MGISRGIIPPTSFLRGVFNLIRDSLYFIYNGITSEDKNIVNVNIDSGIAEESFFASKTIIKTKTRNKSYFQRIKSDSLSFKVNFAFKNGFTEETLSDIKRWLWQDYYKPLIFNENLNRIYYAIVTSDSNILHNYNNQGYITLNFETNADHAWSPVYTSEIYNLDSNTTNGTNITFINNGDLTICPELSIIKTVENGDVTIINSTNGGLEFKITNIIKNEDLYINNEREEIISNLPNTYRYDDFNNNWMECVRGINNLKVYGKCRLQIKWQCKLL
ncbi:MAG: phage tail family protein [Candidatus Cloacimonetes bacterium]|nr:phage tail family protein [Candidatus Cloacimonadota bacterium]